MMPFVQDKIKGKKKDLRLICVEPTGSPSITKGMLAYDYGDVAGMAPIAFMARSRLSKIEGVESLLLGSLGRGRVYLV